MLMYSGLFKLLYLIELTSCQFIGYIGLKVPDHAASVDSLSVIVNLIY